jgi:hypothetical protein
MRGDAADAPDSGREGDKMTRRSGATTWEGMLVVLALQLACGPAASIRMTQVQQVKSGAIEITLLSPHDALRHGKDTFIIEFRSGGNLVDVGDVRATSSMPMPGMAMFGRVDVQRTNVAGRYAAGSQFDMAGTWRTTMEWDGPAGKGSVIFSGAVQ